MAHPESGELQGLLAGRRRPGLPLEVGPWANAAVEAEAEPGGENVGNAMADFLSILPPLTRGSGDTGQAARG